MLVALLKPYLPNAQVSSVAGQQSRSLSWTLICQDLCSQKVLPSERKETSLPMLLFAWQGLRCLVWAL